jgi:hypothetical protein
MGELESRISASSIAVLEMIAAGSSYGQILSAHPSLTYLDIFHAAQECLDALVMSNQKPTQVQDVTRTRYPRAYEKRSEAEEQRLHEFVRSGLTVARIASRLQRQRSAIRSRIVRLGLVDELSPKERRRLLRISRLDPSQPDPSELPSTMPTPRSNQANA